MVMFLQPITAKLGDVMKLMIHGMRESPTGSPIGTMKFIIGIIHPITSEDGFQTAFVKGFVMGHQWKPFYHRCYLCPYFREDRCIVCISLGEAMYFGIPIAIVIGFRLDEGVERIHYLSIADNHDSYTAYTGAFIVGGFKIYSCKVFHLFL